MAIRHYHHHYRFSYLTSKKRHFSSVFIVIFLLTLLFLGIFRFLTPNTVISLKTISAATIFYATFNTLFRLLVAYSLALTFSIPIALLITKSEKFEHILLPISDIFQSIPVLVFFPAIVLVFVRFHLTEGAVILFLFLGMLWNLVFSMIGGLKTIPKDIEDAAKIFEIKGFNKLRHITIPAIFPYMITGSMLACAEGWNLLIVAESLHNYVPNSNFSNDPLGLGSLLVNSLYQNQNTVFLVALIAMIITITLINFFVWQKLLHIAERFKFD
jgi:NitT/TauT family transport system permease protein